MTHVSRIAAAVAASVTVLAVSGAVLAQGDTKTLIVVTFIMGLVPILGNLISNTVIFVVSLSHSLGVAVAALVYLIVIHKLEYFLNAHIIATRIRCKAWELLVAMLVMEAIFGFRGLIAAPSEKESAPQLSAVPPDAQ